MLSQLTRAVRFHANKTEFAYLQEGMIMSVIVRGLDTMESIAKYVSVMNVRGREFYLNRTV